MKSEREGIMELPGWAEILLEATPDPCLLVDVQRASAPTLVGVNEEGRRWISEVSHPVGIELPEAEEWLALANLKEAREFPLPESAHIKVRFPWDAELRRPARCTRKGDLLALVVKLEPRLEPSEGTGIPGREPARRDLGWLFDAIDEPAVLFGNRLQRVGFNQAGARCIAAEEGDLGRSSVPPPAAHPNRPICEALLSAARETLRSGQIADRRGMDPRTFSVHAVRAYPVNDGALAICRNVTAEEALLDRLLDSSERYRTLVEHRSDLIFTCTPSGSLRFVNSSLVRFFSVPVDALIGRPAHLLAHGSGVSRLDAALDALKAGEPEVELHLEVGVPRATLRSVHWILTPIRDQEGELVEVKGEGRDLTELYRRLRHLEAELGERDALVRRLNERVNDSLQMISSFLSLHLGDGAGTGGQDELLLLQGRIHAVALVHSQMGSATERGDIDFGEYAAELVSALTHWHGVEGAEVDCAVEHIRVDFETAVDLGLVLHELVSNGLRHALRGRDGGKLRVSSRWAEERMLRIIVSDDGPGLPDAVDLDSPCSLGLSMVQSLAHKIGGRLVREDGPGLSVALDLPVPEDLLVSGANDDRQSGLRVSAKRVG